MRRTLLSMACLAVLGLYAQEAHAQVRFGPQASFADDVDLGVGARAMFGLKQFSERLEGIASFDWFFPSGGAGVDWTYFKINANVAYSIPLSGSSALRPYAGGGLNIARISIDYPDIPFAPGSVSSTDIGLNVLGGSKFGSGSGLTPFAELRIELGGGEQFVISGGILF
jgi:hypothetical protein